MELDEFLEKDILHFLEGRKEKKDSVNVDREEDYGLYLTKDYLKEVTKALEKDEISIAQKLFDELKIHYDSLPKGSLEEKKIYSMLEQIYSKINSYLQLKGDSGAIKSFNDTLGQGFQGALSTKIHLTTTKMDKKLDNIDVKLTSFGKDMTDLKATLSAPNLHATSKTQNIRMNEELNKISDTAAVSINNPKIQTNVFQELKMHSDRNSDRDSDRYSNRNSNRKIVSEPSAVFLSTPKIQIVAPDIPKAPKSVPIIDREDRQKRILTVPREVETKDVEDITVFEEHKPVPPQVEKSAPLVQIQEQDIKQPDTQTTQIPQTPHIVKEEPKKRMKLFKIPKKVAAKRQERTIINITEPVQEKQPIQEKISEKIIPEKMPVNNDDFEIMKVNTEKKAVPAASVDNTSTTIEDDLFDSPFQKPTTQKPAENIIFSSIQTPSNASSNAQPSTSSNTSLSNLLNIPSNDPTNSFEGVYSEALKELNLRNYESASKLFMKVLEMKPTHKASIIRLKQCEEAMHDA